MDKEACKHSYRLLATKQNAESGIYDTKVRDYINRYERINTFYCIYCLEQTCSSTMLLSVEVPYWYTGKN